MAYQPEEQQQNYQQDEYNDHNQQQYNDEQQNYQQQQQYNDQKQEYNQQQQQQQQQQQDTGFQCSLCYKPFTADPNTNEIKYKTIGDKHLHFECFKCINCQNVIQGKFNIKDDGTYLCINCIGQQYGNDTQIVNVDKNNPSYCVVCDKQLTKSWIEGAKGEKYHNWCFKCMACGTPLSKEPEYCEHDGKNYCKPCRTKLFH